MTRYWTIVADPPWRYRKQRILTTAKHPETRPEAEVHYPTMSVSEIAALPVEEWAADDAHLYLWVTNPKLFEAAGIVTAWGFEYVTLLTAIPPAYTEWIGRQLLAAIENAAIGSPASEAEQP